MTRQDAHGIGGLAVLAARVAQVGRWVAALTWALAAGMVVQAQPLPPGSPATPDKIHFYHVDALGSVRAVSDDAGTVVARYDYLPFGEEVPIHLNGRNQIPGYAEGGDATLPTKRRFTAKERDSESGLDYFGTRYYSGPQGRFTSADLAFADQVVADPRSWNLYAYTRNNPLRFIDVDGRLRRDANGQLIFAAKGKIDTKFTNGDARRGHMQPGYLLGDDGRKIAAYERVGGSKAYLCDCHGLTFADGRYWINNEAVSGLLKGDGYQRVKKGDSAQVGDVAVFKVAGEAALIKAGGQTDVVHSTTVTGVGVDGTVVEVSGLGGTDLRSRTETPAKVMDAFSSVMGIPRSDIYVEYYRDPVPDRPTPGRVEEVRNYAKPYGRTTLGEFTVE